MTQHSDVFTEAIKASPTITVGGLTLFGVGLADWVLILTIGYTALQIFFLLRDKWYRQRKDNDGRN
jgi:predicted benzoate:H+ symporter BenE